MTELRLADAGIKGLGLQRLSDIGLLVPPTKLLSSLEEIEHYLRSRSESDSGGKWILRPSPVVREEYAPLLSGMYPSYVISDHEDVRPILDRMKTDMASDATDARLALAGLANPRLVFLIQPYLDAAISGIAHVEPSKDPRVIWTTGPLAPLAEGEVSGYPLTVRGAPASWVVRALPEHASYIVLNRAWLMRAVAGLNVARELAHPSEIEWLVTRSGAFYGLQCQPLGGSKHVGE
jgi:hypothetical protein